MPPVLFTTDAASVGGNYCRCRCNDNHAITRPDRWGLVCRVTLTPEERPEGVCAPCVEAMAATYAGT